MSTYNGEKYIREQIDSILAQDCEEKKLATLSLLIRDDGSVDGTQEIIKEYSGKYPEKIQWMQGENKGVIKSFFELIEKADEEADYYALSDQDDYWMPEKMSRGIEKLKELGSQEETLLYCCRPKLVDSALNPIESEIKRPPMRASFENALIENVVTGCTTVFNQSLRHLLVQRFPEFTPMHDWWLYLVASCFGKVYYDEGSYIAYRQHGNNVVGSHLSKRGEINERIRLFRKKRRYVSMQTKELICFAKYVKKHGDSRATSAISKSMTKEHLQLAHELYSSRMHFKARKKLVGKKKLYRQRGGDNKIFQILLLIGSY